MVTSLKGLFYSFVDRKAANPRYYNKYVRISSSLDNKKMSKDTYEYLTGLKSTIGNYARHNNLKIVLSPADVSPKHVKIDMFMRRDKLEEKFFEVMDLPAPSPVKINKYEHIVWVDPSDKEELIPPSRKVFQVISDIYKDFNKRFNKNLK